jgi:hypothetical protein
MRSLRDNSLRCAWGRGGCGRGVLGTAGVLLFSTVMALGEPIAVPATGPAPATQPRPGASRLPIPSAAAQAAAEKLIHELFQSQYAQHTAAARRALAQKLLQQAGETRRDPAARYVLLREARDLASQGADATTAIRAIVEMNRSFQIDALPLKLAALVAIHHDASAPADRQAVVHAALACIDEAVLAEQYDTAARFAALADSAAARIQEVPLALRVRAAVKELGALRQEYEQCRAARRALRQNPDDPACKTTVGRDLCFMRGDWASGLPLLAGGADAALAGAAKQELAASPAGGAAWMALANAWWDIAPSQNRLARHQIQTHAAYWYRRALPGLGGIDLAVVEQRLAGMEPDRQIISQLRPGLITDIYAGQQFQHRLLRRVDGQINNDWGKQAPGEGLPKDDFSVRWSGFLKIDRPGHYNFAVIANTGARLILDGKTLIESENLSRSRKGIQAAIDLAEGAHALRAEVWDGSGIARMILLWAPPGTDKPLPVPPEAFGHDPADATH